MYENILVIDDSETSRMIIKKCFTMTGFETSHFFEAEDGIRALTVLAEHRVDLVVTDLNMPRMDGLTLVKKLKMGDRTSAIPVFVISSMGNETLEQELTRLGVKHIIRKPLTPAKISGIVEGGF